MKIPWNRVRTRHVFLKILNQTERMIRDTHGLKKETCARVWVRKYNINNKWRKGIFLSKRFSDLVYTRLVYPRNVRLLDFDRRNEFLWFKTSSPRDAETALASCLLDAFTQAITRRFVRRRSASIIPRWCQMIVSIYRSANGGNI